MANANAVSITDDCKATKSPCQKRAASVTQRNRSELEAIFARVGLQTTVATKLADEVYEKLGLPADQTISLADFLSLIHCNSESDAPTQQQHHESKKSIDTAKHIAIDYSLNPLNDHMITDLHASGLCCSIIELFRKQKG